MNRSLTIQVFGLLCFALFFISCAKEVPVVEQATKVQVVECRLEVGEPISELFVHGLRGVIEDQPQSNRIVEISSTMGDVVLTAMSDRPGYYEGPASYTVTPETDYSLKLYTEEEVITAETHTPPSMETLSTSKEYLDAHIQGDLVFLEWTGINEGSFNAYFYVIELLPLDDDATEIDRSSGAESLGSILISYTSDVTLSIEDFNFFGPHSIRVSAVSKDFESLYTAQADAFQNGPSNIINGYGYFIGASVIEGSLEIR